MDNRPFGFNGRTYQWLRDGQRWDLRTGDHVVARVLPDVVYPNMYRVEHRGALFDLASLSRAKDAALSIADRALDNRPARPQRRPPMRQNKRGATRVASTPHSAG
jgi:hypothetical protein